MKETSIIISGFGGQGTLFAGQLMAYAAMDYGKEVTWIPSYGPEMRGGTARCTVIISDGKIGSPVVRNPNAVIAMNLPSVEMYEPLVAPGGYIIINESLIDLKITRSDIHPIYLPGNSIAKELGNIRITNMVMMGALLETINILPLEELRKALDTHIPERHRGTLPINFEAMERGASFVRSLSTELA